MLCAKPIETADGQRFGCGSCPNCTINKRRAWTARILLEGKSTEAAGGHVSWVTLTYAPAALPQASRGGGELVPTLSYTDYQRLFKRMRKRASRGGVGSFRYALVGEYGDQTDRPHYHALVFGPHPFHVEQFLSRTWEREAGHTRTRPWGVSDPGYNHDEMTTKRHRAQYCAHYVTKKMNTVDSPKLKLEQIPEFWRVSRCPGLGCTPYLLRLQTTKGGAIDLAETGDVMRQIRLGGRIYPVHQNVRAWLREQLGIPQTHAERLALNGPPERERPKPTEADYLRAREQCAKIVRQQRARSL